jgi:hypothetical protein
MPALAQRFPYSDPNLIEKLSRNDYQNIGNDNLSRQDLIGVIAAFGLPDDPKKKCDVVADDSLQGGLRLARYIQFLQSDSRTGQYPSTEARDLAFISALFPDPPYVYVLDPNLGRMADEIARNGCNSARIQTIRKNLVQLLDDRIAGRNIPASSATAGLPNLTPEEIAARRRVVQAQIEAAQRQPPGAPLTPSTGGPSAQPAPTPQPARPAAQAPAAQRASPPPARPAQPAPAPAPPEPSVIPARTALVVRTVDVIDLENLDETRIYKANTAVQAMSGTRVVVPQGTEVLLKVSRQQQPVQPNVTLVEVRAVSTTVDGKAVTLTATPFITVAPGGGTGGLAAPKELPAGTTMSFVVQTAQ